MYYVIIWQVPKGHILRIWTNLCYQDKLQLAKKDKVEPSEVVVNFVVVKDTRLAIRIYAKKN